jgi:DNA sulfur modification protein DndE
MKFKTLSVGLMALSAVLALAGPVSAEAAKLPPQQEKVLQAWLRSLAVQAATYGSSIVGVYNLRNTVAVGPHPKVAPNELWRLKDIATPQVAAEAGYVTPNVNTVYGFGLMDLAQEPIILTTPDSEGRYYMVEIVDMWDNAFAYAAGKEAGYRGGKYALVGPGWKGELPADVKRIDAPTRWVVVQPRVHVKDEADLAGAEKVLQGVTVQGLSEFLGKPALKPLTYDYEVPKLVPKVASSQLRFENPLQFWSIFSAALNENPPPQSQIDAVLPQFKYLGIELGKQWKPGDVNPLVLEEMKLAAAEVGEMMDFSGPLAGKPSNGWDIPPANFGKPGADYLTRGINAVLGLTANTTTEAIYYLGATGSDGKLLHGKNKYEINFKGSIPYAQAIPPGFWSVTMYDGETKLTVPNPINRYSLGSDNELKKNADGSFTFYLQETSPGKDKESNWLPSPKGPYYLLLRNYAPVPEAVEALKNPNAFPMPPIEVVK